jgi:tetratricopeptide (TPR) repeat protein
MRTYNKIFVVFIIIVGLFVYYIYNYLFKPVNKDSWISKRKKYIYSLYKLESDVGRTLVEINNISGNGYRGKVASGFFINNKGDVLTIKSRLRGANDLYVFSVSSKGKYSVKKIVKEDENSDLIVLSIEKKDLVPYVYPINNERVKVGDRIFGFSTMLYCAVGRISSISNISPLGEVYELDFNIPEFTKFNGGRTFDEGTPILNEKKEIIAVAYNFSKRDEYGNLITKNIGIPISNLKKMKKPFFEDVETFVIKDKALLTLLKAADSNFSKGKILFNFGKYKKSLVFLKKALGEGESKEKTELYIAKVYIKTYRYKEAEELLENMIQNNSNNYEILTVLGELYVNSKEFKKARDVLEKVYRKNSDSCNIKKLLGMVYSYLIIPLKEYDHNFYNYSKSKEENYKLYKKTVNLLNNVQRNCGKSKEVYCCLGNSYEKMELYSLASEAFYSAIKMDEEYVKAYYGLADCHIALKHWTLAINTLEKVEKFSHLGEWAVYNLGIAYFKTGNIVKAKFMHKKLKELNSRYSYKLERLIKEDKLGILLND